MANVSQFEHSLLSHHMTRIRDVKSDTLVFRHSIQVIGELLAYETLRTLDTKSEPIHTPLAAHDGRSVCERVAIVPILRAGLALVDPFIRMLPHASVLHLGMYRDEKTTTPVWYYNKLDEDLTDITAFVLDPMLATGGSLIAAIDELKSRGAGRIRVASIIAAPEGIDAVTGAHPDVEINVCEVDSHLNDAAFIVPGLGDAGDRYFGTAQ